MGNENGTLRGRADADFADLSHRTRGAAKRQGDGPGRPGIQLSLQFSSTVWGFRRT